MVRGKGVVDALHRVALAGDFGSHPLGVVNKVIVFPPVIRGLLPAALEGTRNGDLGATLENGRAVFQLRGHGFIRDDLVDHRLRLLDRIDGNPAQSEVGEEVQVIGIGTGVDLRVGKVGCQCHSRILVESLHNPGRDVLVITKKQKVGRPHSGIVVVVVDEGIDFGLGVRTRPVAVINLHHARDDARVPLPIRQFVRLLSIPGMSQNQVLLAHTRGDRRIAREVVIDDIVIQHDLRCSAAAVVKRILASFGKEAPAAA